MTTGQKIKAARLKAGMTQAELAKKLGVAYQNIGQFERDVRKPKIDTLERIAAALGVFPTELLSDRDQGFLNDIFSDLVYRITSDLKNSCQKRLLESFERLNDKGQQVAVERVEELTKIPDYQAGKAAPGSATEPTDCKE